MSALLSASPALVTNERGGPVPSAELLARLGRVAPELGLRWIANLDQSCWAVTWEWPASDARWARVQAGEISRESAYDILGYLPVGCTADEAAPFLESHLRSYPKEEISRLRAKVAQWNDVAVPAEQVSGLIADTLDEASRSSREAKGLVVVAPKGRVKRKKA